MKQARMETLKIYQALLSAMLAVALWATGARAVDVTISWLPPIPANNVAGYYVYHGPQSGQYDARENAGTNLTHCVIGLGPASNRWFAMTAYSAAGNESRKSLELVWDNTPPVLRWTVAALDIEVATEQTQVVMPDIRQFVRASDDISGPAVTLSQSPAAGVVLPFGEHIAAVTARDEAGNETRIEMSFSVRAFIHFVPREVHGTDSRGRQLQTVKLEEVHQ